MLGVYTYTVYILNRSQSTNQVSQIQPYSESGIGRGVLSEFKVSKKAKIRNLYNQVPFQTLSQQVTTRLHAINRQESMTNTKHKYHKGSKKKHCLGSASKTILLEGLN